MTVVAIQNDPAKIKVLTEAFRKCGAIGVFCNTAEAGIELLLHSRCDLIVLDLALPAHNGMWALRKIREENHLSDIPIIAVSSYHSPVALLHCTALGVSEYLVSPLSANLLAQKITLLERIALLTREVPDKSQFSNILIEDKPEGRIFRFLGHFSRYSVLQFQNLYTPGYRDETQEDVVVFNLSTIPAFGQAQMEPFRLICEIAKPKQALIIAGKHFGEVMPLVFEPETCLFMNQRDALDFLRLRAAALRAEQSPC